MAQRDDPTADMTVLAIAMAALEEILQQGEVLLCHGDKGYSCTVLGAEAGIEALGHPTLPAAIMHAFAGIASATEEVASDPGAEPSG